jgi:transglutaminase-like putative cysteine protease
MFENYSIETVATDPRLNHVSTKDTIVKMCQLVRENLGLPTVSAVAAGILAKTGKATPSDIDIIRGTYWWVKQNIRFTEDNDIILSQLGITNLGSGKELLLSPEFLLLQLPNAVGDCDDFSTLLVTLLMQNGVMNNYFCTIAADKYTPDDYTHVYVKTISADGRVISLDTSHGMYPGWETRNIYKSTDWSVVSMLYNSASGFLSMLF